MGGLILYDLDSLNIQELAMRFKKEVEFHDLKGNKKIFEGIYRKQKSTSIDEPDVEYENLVAVVIGGRVIDLEGFDYFYHPDTGDAYSL